MIFLFFFLWILLSGQITPEVCLSGALISMLVWIFCRRVFGYRFTWEELAFGKLWGGLCYLMYLIREMLRAGWIVMKLIYTSGKNTEPRLIYFHSNLKSERARSILANSITLTAGTITVSAEGDLFCVHTLDRTLAAGIENSAFEKRLEKLENGT